MAAGRLDLRVRSSPLEKYNNLDVAVLDANLHVLKLIQQC